MKLLNHNISMKSRSDIFNIYPIGDAHIGAYNFATSKFKTYIQQIKNDPNGLWVGGGDILDAIILQDQKRFDPENLPDWLLSGNPNNVRCKIKDILKAQLDYAQELLEPIKDKCVGMIEGNHEYSISHYHNRDIHEDLCERLSAINLTDCAFIRFKCDRSFTNNTHAPVTACVRLYICHGFGGGRSAGAEPTHLNRLAQERDCEIILRGHSHIFHIMPPIPRLTIPSCGALPEHAMAKEVRAANWGCWLLSYAQGPSTYDSRANYPVRPMCTVVATIKPFHEVSKASRSEKAILRANMPKITLQEVVL